MQKSHSIWEFPVTLRQRSEDYARRDCVSRYESQVPENETLRRLRHNFRQSGHGTVAGALLSRTKELLSEVTRARTRI
jgi:hypothetical protein